MRIGLYLIIYIATAIAFSGCERLEIPGDDITISDIQEEEKEDKDEDTTSQPSDKDNEKPTEGEETPPTSAIAGSEEAPYTVEEACTEIYEANDVWVQGYIVGWIKGSSYSGAQFSAEGAGNTNLLIADSPTEKDVMNCMPVQLPGNSTTREDLNLQTHPENLGRKVKLAGDITYYFKTTGLKNANAYKWADATGEQPSDDKEEENDTSGPTTIELEEDFSTYPDKSHLNIDGWNITGSHSCTWSIGTKGYEKFASVSYTYFNENESYETWLFTPPIDLDKIENPRLTFDTAYLNWDGTSTLAVYILETNDPGKNMILTRLDAPTANQETISEGNWLHAGEISLSAYRGVKYIGFRYRGKATQKTATTFRLDNLRVSGSL